MSRSLRESSLLNTVDYRSLSVGSVPTSEYLITSALLTQNEPSITFNVSGLGDTYKHLKICFVARTDRAAQGDAIRIRFNGDSGSNYNAHLLFGNGSTITSDYYSSTTWDTMEFQRITGSTAASGVFGSGNISILDPFNVNKNTTVRSLGGMAGVGSGQDQIHLGSGFWNNTSAVTSILIYPSAGTNFLLGSRFSIYGVTA